MGKQITELVQRRNGRIHGREKVLSKKSNEQKITLENIRQMTSQENRKTFDHKFAAIVNKDRLSKTTSKAKEAKKIQDASWNNFHDNFMYKSGNYSVKV